MAGANTMNTCRIVSRCLVLLFWGLVLAGCQPADKPLPLLRIGHAPHDHHAPLYIAAMNPGYFKEHGNLYLKEVVFRKEYQLMNGEQPLARVVIEASTGGGNLIRRLAEEQLDMSLGGVPAMLQFIDQGSPIHILAPMMAEGSGLVVNKTLPAGNWPEFVAHARQRQTPLKIGYKIGISVQNLIFEEALKREGISFSHNEEEPAAKIQLINLSGAQNLLPALENGLIDGFIVNQPQIAQAEEQRVGKTVAMLNELPQWEGHPCCALAGLDGFVRSQPQATEAMVTLLLRAIAYINQHPAESAAQTARWLEVSPAVEARSIPTIKYLQEFDASWHRGIEVWVQAMISSGALTDKVKKAHETGTLSEQLYDLEVYGKARTNQ